MFKVKYFQTNIVMLLLSMVINGQSYELVWSEEFNGRNLNENIWTRVIGGNGWGNEELQYYTDRDTNVFIEDGKLIIQALEESYLGKNYTSARLNSQDNKSFKYGKIEASIKLPYGQGLWPAFWMLGQDFATVGWPACGEIDIMEMVGGTNNDNTVHGTVHWSNNGQHAEYGGSYKLNTGIFADDFHTFSIEWTPQFIKWFVDGAQYHIIDITPSQLSEFQQDFFIILNVAVGGIWPGSPNSSTVFPQRMEVDYVRVYQDISNLPKISLTSPIENENINEFDDITITASIDSEIDIEKVKFYQGDLIIGETNVEPFSMNWRNISAGNYKIKAEVKTANGFSSVSETKNIVVGSGAEQYPYSGTPTKIPGVIEAEEFDGGGSGIAYSDNSVQNEGGSFRVNEGVDIEECSDEFGGYNVGWTEQGEWIKYKIDIQKSGEYELTARVASENSNGRFSIEIDNVAVVSSISVPNTGDWQNWSLVTTNISLTEGIHEFKFVVDNGEFNINKFEIYEPDSSPTLTLLSPSGGETFGSNTVQEIRWEQLKVNEISIGLSTDGGGNWSFLAKNISSNFGFHRWLVPDVHSENCIIMIIDSKNSSLNDVTSNFTIDNVNSLDDENINKLPGEYYLFQNYPNPFNPATKISFTLPVRSEVDLSVYDILGKEVVNLVDEYRDAGIYSVEFDASGLPSGVYYYTMKTSNFSQTRKMLLVK